MKEIEKEFYKNKGLKKSIDLKNDNEQLKTMLNNIINEIENIKNDINTINKNINNKKVEELNNWVKNNKQLHIVVCSLIVCNILRWSAFHIRIKPS